jgi:hypothetical protein
MSMDACFTHNTSITMSLMHCGDAILPGLAFLELLLLGSGTQGSAEEHLDC